MTIALSPWMSLNHNQNQVAAANFGPGIFARAENSSLLARPVATTQKSSKNEELASRRGDHRVPSFTMDLIVLDAAILLVGNE